MKRLLVTSLAVLSIASGVAFYIENTVDQPVVNVESSRSAESVENLIVKQPEIINDEIVVTPVETPVVEQAIAPLTNEEAIKIISDRLLIGKSAYVYIFVTSDLMIKYPEKFTRDNIQSSIDYIESHFAGSTPSTFPGYRMNFHW